MEYNNEENKVYSHGIATHTHTKKKGCSVLML